MLLIPWLFPPPPMNGMNRMLR